MATAKTAATVAAGDPTSVSVELASAKDVLVVPVSAVTRDAAGSEGGSDQAPQAGVVQRKTVTLGGVGTALPTTSSTRLRTGGAGGFGPGAGGAPPGGGALPGGR